MLLVSLLSLYLVACVASETIHFEFNITQVLSNPDGLHIRPAIGVNDQWPPPQIEARVGDTIVVNILNLLTNQSTSLHFHGISMKGTPHMDGAAQVSQCPIRPGDEFQYIFQVTEPGTYWYHAHDTVQVADGLRGLLIVRDPASPYKDQYDEEIVLTVSDWYHRPVTDLLAGSGDEDNFVTAPLPDSILLNDGRDLDVHVQSDKTYFIRVGNVGGFTGLYFHITDHELVVVETDGVYTKPATARGLYLAPGQRYSFLLKAKNDSSGIYPVIITPDVNEVPTSKKKAMGSIIYDTASTSSETRSPRNSLRPEDFLDDILLVPLDGKLSLDPPDRTITLDLKSHISDDRTEHWSLENSIYPLSTVPTLYTALATKQKAADVAIYSPLVNPFILGASESVELIMNNELPQEQVLHLHGHKFQVLHRGEAGAGPLDEGRKREGNYSQTPMRRDTVVVNPGGSLVLRFKADNPGVWALNSQIAFPPPSGLVATFIVSPLELQRSLWLSSIPIPFADACIEPGVSIVMGTPISVEGQRTPSDSIKYDSLKKGNHESQAATNADFADRDGLIYPLIYLVIMGAAVPMTLVLLWPQIRWCAGFVFSKWHGARGPGYRNQGCERATLLKRLPDPTGHSQTSKKYPVS
ncbi:Cupredoxin [Aspergillus pseudoustus]|uniref:Cupredoxin n=1 Tax=Aspergillus pseudoustus TaxID=1810923 RepID=A0ABR4JHI6_9EURO